MHESGGPPLFVEPQPGELGELDAFLAWVEKHRSAIDALIVEYGGIIFRGFPIQETQHFNAVIDLFPSYQGDYKGGVAPRKHLAGKVMEATRIDHAVLLRLHSEMAYLRDFPARIAFFSKKTAEVGGETIIADVRGLPASLPLELSQKLERHGVMTVRNYAPRTEDLEASVAHMDLRGWNLAFETDSRADVESVCEKKGLQPIWNADGSLTVINRTPAFAVHPQTGEKLYRSNLHSYTADSHSKGLDPELVRKIRESQEHPTGTWLGNGESLSPEEVQEFDRYFLANTRAWKWLDGDVMVLDNLQTWHGRNPYEGSRDVQVALLD